MGIDIVSPIDSEVLAHREFTPDREVKVALDRARRAQADWAEVDLGERALRCTALVDAMNAMSDDIVVELARQMGRPVSAGAGELAGFDARARRMIELAPAALQPLDPDRPDRPDRAGTSAAPVEGIERYVTREPLGIVLVVAPWNYPLLTAVNTIVPALMAGNVVLLKHASQTLLTGERFSRAAEVAGLGDGCFTNLVLSHDQTAGLLEAGAVDRVNFTGSVEAGRRIERSAAGTFIGVGLELGGKDPAYIRPDADLDFAIEQIADGGFFNSGQSCCGIERVYAHERIHQQLVEGLVTHAEALRLADPLEAATTLGPMVSARAADGVRAQVDAAVGQGAHELVGPAGEHDVAGSAYHGPRVLVGVDHSMAVMNEETFGPVLGVMSVADDEEALRLMNDSRYGLSASIWTQDLEAARSLGRRLETGTVFMNRADHLDPDLAWTGVKETGRGATLSPVGYEQLTRPKSFHLRHQIP